VPGNLGEPDCADHTHATIGVPARPATADLIFHPVVPDKNNLSPFAPPNHPPRCGGARRRISRVLSRLPRGLRRRGWPFLWDARCRAPLATDPSGGAKVRPASRGSLRRCLPLLLGLAPGGVFPAAAVAGKRGALLPHRFTLTTRPACRLWVWRCPFCGTVPGVAPAGRYPAPYLRGARTFLSSHQGEERPSGRLADKDLGAREGSVKGPQCPATGSCRPRPPRRRRA
jgi:hypothetical protein